MECFKKNDNGLEIAVLTGSCVCRLLPTGKSPHIHGMPYI